MTRNSNRPLFIAKKSITNLTQHKQKESELLKDDLYFSVQPDKILKCDVFIILKSFFVH